VVQSPSSEAAIDAAAAAAQQTDPTSAVADSHPPVAASLRAAAARGSFWALVGYGGAQVLRLGGNLVMWRLLYAEAFGLMAIVNVFMQGLAMFSDVGIGPSIIQNERGDDPAYLNTAWTIQAFRGFALFAVACAAALPVAHFYHEPQLAELIPIVGLGSAIGGFNSTKLFTVTRQIALGRLTAIDLSSQALGLVVMVGWAIVTRSIWALVVGGIASTALRLLMGHLMLPGVRNRLCWDRSSAHALVRFGRWIFVSTLLTFAVMQSDRLIFGKLISMKELGVYSIAVIWATVPTQVLSRVFQSVLFPLLSRLYNAGVDFPRAFRETRIAWLIGAGWLAACLIGGGPSLIRFLYDKRALDAGWILQVLTAGSWFLCLEMTNGCALLAQGRSKWVAAGSAAKLAGMVIFIPLGLHLWGFPGAVRGFAASELCRYAVSASGAALLKLRGWSQDVSLSALVLVTSGLGFLVARGAGGALSGMAAEHARAQAFLEGFLVFLVLSAVWAAVYLSHRARPKGEPRPA